MKSIREIALTPYYPYGRNKENIIAERIFEFDEAFDELDSVIRADEREKVLEKVSLIIRQRINFLEERESIECSEGRWVGEVKTQGAIEELEMIIEQIKKEQKNG